MAHNPQSPGATIEAHARFKEAFARAPRTYDPVDRHVLLQIEGELQARRPRLELLADEDVESRPRLELVAETEGL